MKHVRLNIYVLTYDYHDGDKSMYLHTSREEAEKQVYDYVAEDWGNMFEDEDIDDYTEDEAIDHYFCNNDSMSYTIDLETVSFTVAELQDQIAKAIGLATHG